MLNFYMSDMICHFPFQKSHIAFYFKSKNEVQKFQICIMLYNNKKKLKNKEMKDKSK